MAEKIDLHTFPPPSFFLKETLHESATEIDMTLV
jgi:hypothetical protein